MKPLRLCVDVVGHVWGFKELVAHMLRLEKPRP